MDVGDFARDFGFLCRGQTALLDQAVILRHSGSGHHFTATKAIKNASVAATYFPIKGR
jgi:hypothetical protein